MLCRTFWDVLLQKRPTFSKLLDILNIWNWFITKAYGCTYTYMYLTSEGPCIIFCNIYTFQRDTQCSSTDCLLMLRCQLYMFRTVTVHPQELLFRWCMCRLWYVVRTALSDTSSWYNVWGRTASSSSNVISLGLTIFDLPFVLQPSFWRKRVGRKDWQSCRWRRLSVLLVP